MKLVVAGIALLLLGSASAESGIFSGIFKGKNSLPKPIDSPIVRPKAREDHKAGKRNGQHPSAFNRSEYGAEWDKIFNTRRPHPIPEYLYQTQ
jgi:hypothetical protein